MITIETCNDKFIEYMPLKDWAARECMTRQYAQRLAVSGRVQSRQTVHGYEILSTQTRADITPIKRGARPLSICEACGQKIRRGVK
jgi:hypothetical protein